MVFLSRLPFLTPGFGTDNDAWELAKSARHIGITGDYVASRFPGYPVQEFISALGWQLGPIWINGLTAFFSTIATLFFALSARILGVREYIWMSLAFAFIPTVYISSPTGMDYMWAMAFLMGSFCFVLIRKPLIAGIFLGIACGCRITSCVFFIPFVLMLMVPQQGSNRWKDILVFTLSSVLIGIACYIPVMLRYPNFEFLSYYEPFGEGQRTVGVFLSGILNPSLPYSPLYILGLSTVGVWGVIGFTVLCVTFIVWLIKFLTKQSPLKERRAIDVNLPKTYIFAWIAALLLVFILFWRLPHDEGYLIPGLPFVLLLLAYVYEIGLMRLLCTSLILSSFFIGVDVAPPKKGVSPDSRSSIHRFIKLGRETFVIDYLRGPMLMDYDKRVSTERLVQETLIEMRSWNEPTLLIAGLLDKFIQYHYHEDVMKLDPNIKIVDKLSMNEVLEHLENGYNVYYLPDARERTLRAEEYDLEEIGAMPKLQ